MDSKTILFVEDQIDFLAINKLYLERHGYRVLAAGDGEQAVRAAQEHRPDLILMDYSVPGLNGVGAMAQLQCDPDTRHIPVVLLTAHTYGSVGRQARAAGCTNFIWKPCEPRRVLDEVQRLIG